MDTLVEICMRVLRDKKSTMAEFRNATNTLAQALVYQATQLLQTKTVTVATPLEQPAKAHTLAGDIVLIPILRSGLALLPVFLQVFTNAKVGFFGMKRDEKTAKAHLYYQKLPTITPNDQIILLDPMLATGGSTTDALSILTKQGIKQEQIIYVGVIGAQEGVDHLKKEFPAVRFTIAAVDQQLNAAKYIVPGLGDFGDRYFGTPQ